LFKLLLNICVRPQNFRILICLLVLLVRSKLNILKVSMHLQLLPIFKNLNLDQLLLFLEFLYNHVVLLVQMIVLVEVILDLCDVLLF